MGRITDGDVDDAAVASVLEAAGVRLDAGVRWEKLGDASYNTALRVRLTDTAGLIVKIAPDPARPALSYEHNVMQAEALFYRHAIRAVPVPELVLADFSKAVIDRDFLVMTELPGENWHSQRKKIDVARHRMLRAELGNLLAALHGVIGSGFGYPQDVPCSSWRAAFAQMMQQLLDDAERFAAPLPCPPQRIRHAVDEHADILDDVTTPALVHFDLWAGNVLVDGTGITGLVDGERAFWGDPLAEMASLALFGDIEQDTAFTGGYTAAGGTFAFDERSRRRLALYRCYLYTIMLVERVPRGHTEVGTDEIANLTGAHLLSALAVLES